MNKFCQFLSDHAVEKMVNMQEHIYSFSKNHSITRLSDLIAETEHSVPYKSGKYTNVFMFDKHVVKRDERPYMKRCRQPAVEAINTLIANKLGIPSHTLLGVKYLPIQKYSTYVFERIHGRTLKDMIRENPEDGIIPLLKISHECFRWGLYHSDIKSENIFYDEQISRYRLIDFERTTKLNNDTGMGLALSMANIGDLGLIVDVSIYISTVIDYLRSHFGHQPQHMLAFLYFYSRRLRTKHGFTGHTIMEYRIHKHDSKILRKMVSLNRPEIFTALPDFH